MAEIFCFRCAAEKKNRKTNALHNVMCEKAKPEEIKQAGETHMNAFTKIWVAVQSYIGSREK